LMALRDAGWRVVNLACSLGHPSIAARRRSELVEACNRVGFELVVAEDPAGDPPYPDGALAQEKLHDRIAEVIERIDPSVIVGPSPHDRHRRHEVVGRAVIAALESAPDSKRRLWLWGLWGDLPFPTIVSAFDNERVAEITHGLAAYAGEIERNDYRRLVIGRSEMNSSLGPERVFGFGCTAADVGSVELLCEVGVADGIWRLGVPRWFDSYSPLPELSTREIGEWLHMPSLTDRYGLPGDFA
jgi:hypothetical protein